jgi:hypothetical protein
VPDVGRSPRSWWKVVLKLLVSVGLLGYLLHRVDAGEIARTFLGADGRWLAAAFGLYLAGQVISATKWRMLARAVGFDPPLRSFLRYYFVGMFFNAFGLGTVGGDVVRALYLGGGPGRRALALNTVLADRVSGLLVLLVIALASLVCFHQYELPAALYWGSLVLSAGLLAGWQLAPILAPLVLPAGNRLRRLVEEDLEPYWRDWGLLGRVAAVSLVFHLSQIGSLALVARALGLAVPGSYFFIFGPLVNVMAALPVSWNGLGVREGGYVFFLAHIGIGRDSAIAFALCWFAIVMLGGLCGGCVYLAGRSAPPGLDEGTPGAHR